jgi:hypothetical protein
MKTVRIEWMKTSDGRLRGTVNVQDEGESRRRILKPEQVLSCLKREDNLTVAITRIKV